MLPTFKTESFLKMRRFFQFILSPNVILVVIFVFLIQGLLLKGRFEIYRFSDQTYIYKYGTLISRGLVYIALVLSFLYPLIIWSKAKNGFRKNLLLMFIGFLPALYFIILYALSS
jgi:hypothetical protein